MIRVWVVCGLFFLTGCTAVDRDLPSQAMESRATAEMAEARMTSTAQAPILSITQTAAALTVRMTEQSIYGTATAQSWTPTPSPTPTLNATATVEAAQVAAIQQQISNQVERDNLQLERDRQLNGFYAWLPVLLFAIGVGVLAMSLVWIARRERYRPVMVDERGNPIPIMDVVEGTVTDIDRSPNYRGALNDNLAQQWVRQKMNLPALLPPVTAERQDATTQRDQMVDLATRGLPGQTTRRPGIERALLAPPENGLQDRFKILPQGEGENLEIVDGEIVKVLDEDWRTHGHN